jgi:hypothetical protein
MILISAKEHHVRALVDNLRECDRQELLLQIPESEFLSNALRGWGSSVICEAILTPTGEVAGVWGVAPLNAQTGVGSIWMLGTPAINKVALPFLRQCPRSIEQAHERFEILVCTPWRENSLHLAWLNWCGFSALDPGHGPYLAYTHVRSSSGTAGDAGRDGCVGGGPEQHPEQEH